MGKVTIICMLAFVCLGIFVLYVASSQGQAFIDRCQKEGYTYTQCYSALNGGCL